MTIGEELCTCEGCPMTTGAREVTTVDELQHPVLLGGGDGGGTLTPRFLVNSVAVRGPLELM